MTIIRQHGKYRYAVNELGETMSEAEVAGDDTGSWARAQAAAERQARDRGEYVPSIDVRLMSEAVARPAGPGAKAVPVREETHRSPDPYTLRLHLRQTVAVYRVDLPDGTDVATAAGGYADADPRAGGLRRVARVADGVLWVQAAWVGVGA